MVSMPILSAFALSMAHQSVRPRLPSIIFSSSLRHGGKMYLGGNGIFGVGIGFILGFLDFDLLWERVSKLI